MRGLVPGLPYESELGYADRVRGVLTVEQAAMLWQRHRASHRRIATEDRTVDVPIQRRTTTKG